MPAPHDSVGLGLAVVKSSSAPLVLLDADQRVIAPSTSFCRLFLVDPATASGTPLASLGEGEWDVPQLASLLTATLKGHAAIDGYEFDLCRPGHDARRLVVNAHKLVYGTDEPIRLLLSVADITEARLAERVREDLVREKSVLLQELQHRVANSLQIIASVLLQSARRVQSDEIRSHLHAAHQRVMSVAALQRQLAVSSKDDVALHAYFTDLCHSIGASMICDPDLLTLEVNVDGSIAGADISVSMGLIVTELVINALKHAFPGDRPGRIVVAYQSADADGWTLSVHDDGVGMDAGAGPVRKGLGTSIIQALAKQLDATIAIKDTAPGTEVSVTHVRRGKTIAAPAA